jgi:hypothetical protein
MPSAARAQRSLYAGGDRFLGITVPVLRQLARTYRDLRLAEVVHLLKSPWHEERLLDLVRFPNHVRRRYLAR